MASELSKIVKTLISKHQILNNIKIQKYNSLNKFSTFDFEKFKFV